MSKEYTKTVEYWDDIFTKSSTYDPDAKLSNEGLERSIAWVADGTKSVVDFGCGTGRVVLHTLSYGTEKVVGIDISNSAISLANTVVENSSLGDCAEFYCGGTEKLSELQDDSFDGAILYNIVDNLTPDDSEALLREVHRIVSPNGKVLIKLNPLITDEQIKEYGIERITNSFLKEPYGIYLINHTTDEWQEILSEYFTVDGYEEVFFPEHELINRMFYLINK